MCIILLFNFQGALISPTHEEYDVLLERLSERISEAQGETIYVIGTGGKITVAWDISRVILCIHL